MPGLSQIHIWQLPFAVSPEGQEGVCNCLDGAEQLRASQYRHAQARAAFIQTRCCLRQLLGHYLKRPPDEVRIAIGQHGKPRLEGSAPDSGLVFNVSHTSGQAILGFAIDTALGLDLESVRPNRNLAALARFCLSPEELEDWQAMSPDRKPSEFTRMWVCKEAFAKAVGRGIAVGLCDIVVTRDFTGLQSVPVACGDAREWRIHVWETEGCRAAAVYAGPLRQICIF